MSIQSVVSFPFGAKAAYGVSRNDSSAGDDFWWSKKLFPLLINRFTAREVDRTFTLTRFSHSFRVIQYFLSEVNLETFIDIVNIDGILMIIDIDCSGPKNPKCKQNSSNERKHHGN